jgi:hypothetical protein
MYHEVVIASRLQESYTRFSQFIINHEKRSQVKPALATFIKRFIKLQFRNSNEVEINCNLSIDNDEDAIHHKMKISKLELQLICDVLEGKDISKYKKLLVKRIVGKELNPIQYEMLVSGDSEITSIKRKYDGMIAKLKDECWKIVDDIETDAYNAKFKTREIFKTKIAVLIEEKNAKLKEVKKSMRC